MSKICTKCDQEKPLISFSLTPSGNPRGVCKACRSSQYSGKAGRKTRLKREYGLTLEQYNLMVDEQEGCCVICDAFAEDQPHGTLCVDHNHATGEVRGLLCGSCNRALGFMGDNPDTVQRAADYLKSRGSYSK